MSVPRRLATLLLLAAGAAQAHRGHESQLALSVQAERVQGRWTLSLHDLPAVLQLGAVAADDSAIAALIAAKPALDSSLLERLRLAADGAPCPIKPLRHELAQRQGGAAWVVHFEARCPAAPARLMVELRALFERDPEHLMLLKLEVGAWVRAAVFSADSARQVFQPD